MTKRQQHSMSCFASVVLVVILGTLGPSGCTVAQPDPLLGVMRGYGIRFRPEGAGPPHSFIMLDQREANVTSGQKAQIMYPKDLSVDTLEPFPRIVIQIVDSNGNLDATVSGGYVKVTSLIAGSSSAGGGGVLGLESSSLYVDSSTNSAPFFRGEAHLTNLQLHSTPPEGTVRLRFTAINTVDPRPNYDGAFLDTAPISVYSGTARSIAHKIAFSKSMSLLTREGQPVPIAPSELSLSTTVSLNQGSDSLHVGTIRVNVMTSSGIISTAQVRNGPKLNGVIGCYLSEPDQEGDIQLSGNLAHVREYDGTAVFSNLRIILSDPSSAVLRARASRLHLVFNATISPDSSRTPSTTIPELKTGPLSPEVFDSSYEDTDFGFMREDLSFFFTESQSPPLQQTLHAATGVKLPPVKIQLLDRAKFPSTTRFTGLVIKAHCDRLQLQSSGSTAGMVDGVATFDQLIFQEMGEVVDSPRDFIITFTAGSQSNLGVAGKKLYSGYISVANWYSQQPPPAASLKFDPNPSTSYFTRSNSDGEFSTPQPFPLPIQLQLLDAGNDFTKNGTYSVSVSADQDVSLPSEGLTVNFVNGIARFVNLRFESKPDAPVRLVFRVSDTDLRIATGEITVFNNPKKLHSMRFQAIGGSSITSPGQEGLYATIDHPMPPVAINILNSVGVVDESAETSRVRIIVSAGGSSSSPKLINNQVQVNNGLAVFDSLTFITGGTQTSPFRITFTAFVTTTGSQAPPEIHLKTLITEPVSLVSNVQPAFRVKFEPLLGSFLAYPGHAPSIQIARSIPQIALVLVDSSGNPLNSVNQEFASSLEVSVETSSGQSSFNPPNAPFRNFTIEHEGVVGKNVTAAVFNDLQISDPAAFDPILTFCVEPRTGLGSQATSIKPSVLGTCIHSGRLSVYPAGSAFSDSVGGITFLAANDPLNPIVPKSQVKLSAAGTNGSLLASEPITTAIAVTDIAGYPLGSRYPAAATSAGFLVQVAASSSVLLTGKTSVEADKFTGVAVFEELLMSSKVPLGVTPIITFSARIIPDTSSSSGGSSSSTRITIQPISTGVMTVVGSEDGNAGTFASVELLIDMDIFDWLAWRRRLAHLLRIEPERIQKVRISPGKGNERDSVVLSAGDDDSVNSNLKPSWVGTKVDLLFLEPLSTSKNLKTSAKLAQFFVNMKTSQDNENRPICSGALTSLMMREAYITGTNNATCDWGAFDDQMLGAQRCLETQGLGGYCGCYVPMFETVAPRCIGLPTLTSLCLDVLGPLAQCEEESIRGVCKQLEFPDAPRLALGASGAFLMLALPPVLYLAEGNFFAKAARPTAGKGKIEKAEFVRSDADNLL